MFRFSHYTLKLTRRTVIAPVRINARSASTAASLSIIPPQTPTPVSPLQITLREYQEECIQSVLSYLDKGHKRLGISLATGSGKTVIFTHLIDRISPVKDASQTLILAHRRELVEQAARHCSLAYPDKRIDIEMGNSQASGAADITVASIQSIMSGERLDKFDPTRYKLVLVDEAHHIVSPQYLALLEHFGLRHAADWNEVPAPALVGVSATFSRFDGRKLGTVIDHIVYHRDYVDMIEENWLTNVIFTTVEMKADLTKVGSGVGGDFQTGALSQAINTNQTNDIVVKAWFARAKERKSTLVFCVDLSHVSNLTSKFREYGIEAQFVTGDTPKRIRSARVDAFRNGEFPVLLNCGVFTEGTDIPNIDCVVLARPTKSRNLLVQMIGRGMRLHKGKENCHIIDLVASLSTGVISTPTLFGLDPDEIVENADTETMTQLKERKEKESKREAEVAEVKKKIASRNIPGSVMFTDYDSIHDLIADSTDDQYIRRISEFAWVSVGGGIFVLTTNSGNYLTIKPPTEQQGSFTAVYYRKVGFNSKSNYNIPVPRVIADADSFEHIVHAADSFAAEIFQRFWIEKRRSWRNAPASEAQIKYLNSDRPKDDQLTTDMISKGTAGDMITRLKHGAKGRFTKAIAKKKTADRIRDKVETVHKRLTSQVQVGPLSDEASVR
ncbi:P-loop containing nucleoside triphosphate hydrolase protein [Pleomassaria siparia CBS 279.74]|uniref:P-loop containing nucleoside triphosphate hydrolase protein n=1 Tax=Pleomassaria siparia CBS 279.74 TaxID=1314801 RepID=A0A6G1KK51_9PLEO|nr:P-loop containing nucleoside triphosphate hydrolase protein [Pleomassaria siparia CBS 279.74]